MSFDPSKLEFSTLYRYEHISAKSHTGFSLGAGGTGTVTIPHNLGYSPFFRVFYGFGDGKIFSLFSGPTSYNIDGNGFQIDNVYADSTNLYVSMENDGGGTVSGTVYYRIYAEPQAS